MAGVVTVLLAAGCSAGTGAITRAGTSGTAVGVADRAAAVAETSPPPDASVEAEPSGASAAQAPAADAAQAPVEAPVQDAAPGTLLAPSAVGEGVSLETGITATVTAVDETTITPRGPGDVAGPGQVVHLRVTNATRAPLDLAGLAVVASTTGDAPAIPSDDPAAEPLTGTLAAGQTRGGVYVFRVPTAGAPVSIELSVNTSSDVAVVDAS